MAGLFGIDLEQQTTNPLFLSGAALLSGEGFGGALKGMQAGQQFQTQRRKQAEDEAQKAQWAQYTQGGMGGLSPEMQALVRASGPQGMGYAAQALAKAPELAMEQQRLKLAQQADARQAQMTQMQMQQIKNQTPEARAAMAPKYGIDVNTPEGRAFVLTGNFSPKDEMTGLISGMVRGALQPQAQPQPGRPMLQPQSFGGEPQAEPQLIQAQASTQPQATQQQQAPAPVGSMFDGKSPQEKRKIGEALMLDPRTKALGEQMMKDTDRERMELGKPAANDLDEKIVAGLDQISRLEAMNQTFDDKYQTIGTRLGMAGTGWMARLDPSKVDPRSAQELAAFARDRRRGIENLNLTIKDITGAAMSNPEAGRIMQQVPNPGTGIFDGDDPISYRAKMKDALDQTRLAVARRAWLKKNNPQLLDQLAARKMEGVENVMPLDRMRDTMNQRKSEIYQSLKQKNPNASREQLLPYVGQMLNQEFGI